MIKIDIKIVWPDKHNCTKHTYQWNNEDKKIKNEIKIVTEVTQSTSDTYKKFPLPFKHVPEMPSISVSLVCHK